MGSLAQGHVVPTADRSLKGKFMKVTDDRVVAWAKSVLLPQVIECETLEVVPNDKFTHVKCETKLNCWEAFQKHQIQHAQDACQNMNDRYTCPFKKCNKKLHRSLESLAAHIDDTHLKGLPCPFATCPTHNIMTADDSIATTPIFTHHSLIAHVHEQHAELVGSRVNRALLLPTAKPHRVAHQPPPPPLPSSSNDDIRLGALFVPPVSVPKTEHFMHLIASSSLPEHSNSPSSSSLPAAHTQKPTKVPYKTMVLRKRPQRPQPAPPSPPAGQSTSEYDFADFPTIEFFRHHSGSGSGSTYTYTFTPLDILSSPNFAVQPVPPERALDLVRGPPVFGRAEKKKAEPEPSIFYPVLQRAAFAGYARGEGAVTDMNLMRE